MEYTTGILVATHAKITRVVKMNNGIKTRMASFHSHIDHSICTPIHFSRDEYIKDITLLPYLLVIPKNIFISYPEFVSWDAFKSCWLNLLSCHHTDMLCNFDAISIMVECWRLKTWFVLTYMYNVMHCPWTKAIKSVTWLWLYIKLLKFFIDDNIYGVRRKNRRWRTRKGDIYVILAF